MKILCAIPFLHGAEHSRLAIESVVNNDVDLLLIDNGASNDVKAVINHYHSRKNVAIISNPENIYVNPAWNQAMDLFRTSAYDYLIIMNSDLIMQKDWCINLRHFLSENKKKIPVPVITENINIETYINSNFIPLHEGIAGVFIVIPREIIEFVYPIPESIKVWFGDNVIYNIIRGIGYECGVLNNLFAMHYHNGSQNVSRVAGISEIIEADKLAWANEVEPMLKEKIKKHSNL